MAATEHYYHKVELSGGSRSIGRVCLRGVR